MAKRKETSFSVSLPDDAMLTLRKCQLYLRSCGDTGSMPNQSDVVDWLLRVVPIDDLINAEANEERKKK